MRSEDLGVLEKMSVKKKSKYRPRVADPMAAFNAILGVKPVASTGDDLVRLRSVNHSALDEVSKGRGAIEHMGVLISVMNMTETLALRGHGKDWLPEIRAAQAAVRSLAIRSSTLGRYVFKAEELAAVNLAFEIHDAQLEACTVREFNDCITHIKQCIAQGKTTTLPGPKKEAA